MGLQTFDVDDHAGMLDALGLNLDDVRGHVIDTNPGTSWIPDLRRIGELLAAPPRDAYRLDVAGFGNDLDAALASGVAGYSVQVRRRGQVVLSRSRSLARSAADGNVPWGNGVPQHLASVSKLIAAIALTRLLRDRGVPRTTPIAAWLPAYWTQGPGTAALTFEDLLNHETGLNFGPGPDPNPDPDRADYLFARDQLAIGTTHHGQRCYQNCNYTLCRIVMATLLGAIPVGAHAPVFLTDDVFWDVVTAGAYETYVRDHVLVPSGVGGDATLDHPASVAMAYTNPPAANGWDSGALQTQTAGVGWHLSVDDLLDVLGECRRGQKVLAPDEFAEMLGAGLGTDPGAPVADLLLAPVHWKSGWWQSGGRVEQSSVYLLPHDVEVAVVANSGFGAAPGSWIVPQVGEALKANTLLDFPIRGVLLAGGFRTQRELNAMDFEDMRNTLIVELTRHSNQRDHQAYDDRTLAGMGAVMVFLRRFGIRGDAELAAMSADDQRNTLIVELDLQTGAGRRLQGFSNLELVQIGLGSDLAWRGQRPGSVDFWIRGVLLLGGFRTQRELNAMSAEDMRNTLIVELTDRTAQRDYQAMNNAELEGAGAALVLLRAFGARDDAALRTMTADDLRNTLIVELDAQTATGRRLQRLSNLQLALTALGLWERRP